MTTQSHAKVLTTATVKGGAGKTTILAGVLWWLHAQGKSLLVVDGDANEHLHDFCAAAEGHGCVVDYLKCSEDERLAPLVRAMRDKYDYILIDTPGMRSRLMLYAVAVTDVFLVVARPSMFDLKDAIRTQQILAEEARQLRRDLNLRCVINGAQKNTKIYRDTKAACEAAQIDVVGAVPLSTTFVEFVSTGKMPNGLCRTGTVELMAALKDEGIV